MAGASNLLAAAGNRSDEKSVNDDTRMLSSLKRGLKHN